MEIKDLIIRDFSKAWEANDSAHRIEHFEEVERCGMHINEVLSLGYDPKLITLVAFFHDMFAWSRWNHHLLSAHWVRTTDYDLIVKLSSKDLELVALGCEEHRGSRTDKFTCEFSSLMNAADRGFPGDVPAMLDRAYRFGMDRGSDHHEATLGAKQHLLEKYGYGGYARYSELYIKTFGDQLEQQRMEIEEVCRNNPC